MERVVVISRPSACPYRCMNDTHQKICVKTNCLCEDNVVFPQTCILLLAEVKHGE